MSLKRKTGASALEYVLLVVVILVTILSVQKYLVRGFAGRWKAAGDAFGLGKQYDPQKTIECTYSEDYNKWYDKNCYDQEWNTNYPPCYSGCFNSCHNPGGTPPCGQPNSDGCACIRCEFESFPTLKCSQYDPNCCDSKCKDQCTGSIGMASVDACEGEPINCNDCCHDSGNPCPPNINCGGP